MAKNKYYVVWIGAQPGIYTTWEDAKLQINGYPNAKYKSFKSLEEAENAYKVGFSFTKKSTKKQSTKPSPTIGASVIKDSIAVDAACSGNPGVMEYRGVVTTTGEQIFINGPFEYGTNNLGEFLALIHGAAMLEKKGNTHTAIYTDSKTAMSWVRNKKVKTTLPRTPQNEEMWKLVDRAILWLDAHTIKNPIIKWPTEKWGEIPADFGRK